MRKWTIRVDSYRSSMLSLENAFLSNPDRGKSRKAFETTTGRPLEEWHPLAILGRLLAAYEKRYISQWRGDRAAIASLYEDVQTLFGRIGAEDTCRAIDAVFSDEMRWVTNPAYSLFNKDFYYRFIMPIVDAQRSVKKKGEQAEYGEEPEDRTPGYRRIEL